jgi:hypothetical protein
VAEQALAKDACDCESNHLSKSQEHGI